MLNYDTLMADTFTVNIINCTRTMNKIVTEWLEQRVYRMDECEKIIIITVHERDEQQETDGHDINK